MSPPPTPYEIRLAHTSKLQKIFSEWTWMGSAERRPTVGVGRETVGCKNNHCRLKIVFDHHRLEMAVTIAG